MQRTALAVQHWAGPGTLDIAALRQKDTPLVLSVATPDTPIRDGARALARSALRDALGILLDRPPRDIPLIAVPGQPLRLDLPESRIGLSLSHEPGLSLAAIHARGAVGIDLMRVDESELTASDREAVARDYLGPQAAAVIGALPAAAQSYAFARAWTRLEAGLKCHGMHLQEWSPELEHLLECCRVLDLDVPHGFVAALALPS